MLKSRVHAVSVTAGLVLALSGACAKAQDFYKDKTVTILVGFTPGGGYDSYARVLSRHLGAHIAGRPNVIVQNMPGAGSLVALRALNATQPVDGTVMLIFNPGIITQSVVQPAMVGARFSDYHWIGTVTPDFRVCYGYGPNGVKTWMDMMSRKEFIIGSTAKGSGNYINGATLREVFNAPIKQVLGFPGSAEQRLAIERGELDGDCGSISSIPVQWLKQGLAHPFVRFTEERPEGMGEDVVFVETLAKTDEQRQLLRILNAEDEVGRSFIASGKVPADRLAEMRAAFDATVKDPAFLEDMRKLDLPVSPMSGKATDQLVAQMGKVPPDLLAKVKKIYE
jgi:tripartite-type tricarboxylate transporter receptor subunit TctC